MANLKTVGIKTLKNKLSEYIRDVKRGQRILITDRDTVVAELCEPMSNTSSVPQALLTQWANEGKVRLPLKSKTPVPLSPVSLPDGTAQRLLDEDRGE